MRVSDTLLVKSFAAHVALVRLVLRMRFPMGDQRGYSEIRISLSTGWLRDPIVIEETKRAIRRG